MVFSFLLLVNLVVMLISLSSAVPSPLPLPLSLATGISKFELDSTRQVVEDSENGSSFLADDTDFVLTDDNSSSATTKLPTAAKNALKTKTKTTSDPSEDLLKWKAPLFFQKNMLYYHTGHTDDGMPVWVVKVGKIPLLKLAALDEYGLQVFDKYVEQMTLRIFKSIQTQNTTETEGEVTQAVAILDCDGLGNNYEGVHSKVPANPVMDVVLTIVRPILGKAFDKIELYGKTPTPAKWKNVLHPRLPKDSIPSYWYGGYYADSKPLSIYG